MLSRFCGSTKPRAGRLDDQYPPDQHLMNQGVREEAKTVLFPAQTVATEAHMSLLRADVTGNEGQSCQPHVPPDSEPLLVTPLLTGQLLGRGIPGED